MRIMMKKQGTGVLPTTNTVAEQSVLHLDSRQTESYNGTGNIWYDISTDTNSYDAPKFTAVSASPTFDPVSKSFYFTQGAGFFVANNSQAKQITESGTQNIDFSYELWLKSTTTSGDSIARILNRDPSDYWCIAIKQNQAFPQGLFIDSASPIGSTPTVTNVVNEGWNHVVVNHVPGGAVTAWLNGTQILFPGIETHPQTAFTSNRAIGLAVDSEGTDALRGGETQWSFTGNIAVVRMYQKILSQSDINESYNFDKPYFDSL